ncbi:MAG: aminopeptidase P family protein [Pseudomonadota bacterium]
MRLRQYLTGFLLLSSLSAFATPPNPEPGAEVYAARRAKLLAQLPKGALAILNAAPQQRDNQSYRPDSNFWYLTGMPESGAVALLQADARRYTLYSLAKKWEEEQWTGYRSGQELAKTRYGADAAFTSDQFQKQLQDLMHDASSLWIMDGGDSKFRDQVLGAWNRRSADSDVALPVYNLATTLAEMRLFKDPSEAALLRQAVELSVQAHLAALPLAQGGKGEWALRAAMVNTCNAGAAARMAYPPIVGSGANSVVLHYDADDQLMKQGDMIVNDTACEYGMYAADVTRSYPVGGVFSGEQKAVYEVVLKAALAGQAKAVLGAPLHEVHDATVEVVVDGLLALGIMKGDKADIIAKKSYRVFYPHGSSHWIGLEVHDVGNYKRTRVAKDVPENMRRYASKALVALKPGMAFTIEPGLYIPAKTEGVDPKWWNIGVRIEDDYLVTEKGAECLSCALPRDIPAIEQLMRKL